MKGKFLQFLEHWRDVARVLLGRDDVMRTSMGRELTRAMQPGSTLESSHKETDISNSRTTTISTSTQIASDMSGVLNAQSTFQQDDLLHHHQSQSFLFGQNDHTHQMMDDFLENMLSISSWSDVATVRNQWEYGGGINPATGLNADSFSQGSKLFKSSLMGHAGNDGSVSGDKFSGENSILVTQFPPDPNEMGGLPTVSATCRIPGLGNSSLQLNSESDPSMRLPPLQGIPEDAGPGGSLHVMSSCAADASLPSIMTVVRSGSAGSSPSEGSPGLENPSWRQLYAGNAPAPSLPLSLGQCASFAGLSQQNESHLLGKRFRDDEPDATKDHRLPYPSRDSSPANMYPYGTSQTGPTQSAKQQTGQGLLAPSYAPAAQPTNISSGTVRPRVRARRGQATDPHSIAERLRRERIAERMKALQELVPNANKTDKASMLDEIIDYVKFLQLQVKVLSMSRLGGAGAVAPFVADLPAEGPHGLLASLGRNSGAMGSMQQEGISLTERQVARLMEEDMGSAMQYLQSKGLCLMPISLATAISTTNAKTVGVSSSSGDKRRPEVPLAVSGGCMMLGSASEKREPSCAEKTTASDPQLGKSAKATKSRDENQR